jgi:dihydroceramide fatty acyl 2-hydroxylase
MQVRRQDILKASPPMFESRTLDRLTRVHPIVPPLIFIPAIAVTFALGQEGIAPLPVIAWLLAGYVVWSLTEYWMHRVIFHFEPEQGIGARLHWMIHGVHHDHPNDPMRLVMPPSVSVPLALGFWGLFHLVIGGQPADLVACGFLAGYLVYDMTHYYLHHFRPRSRLGRILRERHMRHHFQDDTRGFGISAPYWDEVFRTSPRAKRTPQ